MELLIENFLSLNSYCPLPKLGTLELKQQSAVIRIGENMMTAPMQKIILNPVQKTAEKFIEFIARKKRIDKNKAAEELISYCDELMALEKEKEISLNQTGIFFINEIGQLNFRQKQIPFEYTPKVSLKRVIHPNRTHRITVGDKEHEATFSSDFAESDNKIIQSRWWIWAAALALIAVASLFYYKTIYTAASGYGNVNNVTPLSADQTYKLVN